MTGRRFGRSAAVIAAVAALVGSAVALLLGALFARRLDAERDARARPVKSDR
jgi:membrane associated rhomboid family serine protease